MKPTAWREGVQELEQLEEDAGLMKRCQEEKVKSGRRIGNGDSEVQGVDDKPWRNEELRNLEEGLPRLREENLE